MKMLKPSSMRRYYTEHTKEFFSKDNMNFFACSILGGIHYKNKQYIFYVNRFIQDGYQTHYYYKVLSIQDEHSLVLFNDCPTQITIEELIEKFVERMKNNE